MDTLARPIAAESELRHMPAALSALKKGDGSIRLPSEWTGWPGKVADAFNKWSTSTTHVPGARSFETESPAAGSSAGAIARERCIQAGAWDYMSKPVDVGRMKAVLRSWLLR